MGWMTNIVRGKTPEPLKPAFTIHISPEEYIELPWTISWDGGAGWSCIELGISSEDTETLDEKCRTACREQFAKALKGHTPILPTGLIWRDGYPKRDPGQDRVIDFRRYK